MTLPLPPDHARSMMLLMDIPITGNGVRNTMTFHEGKAAAVFGAELYDNPHTGDAAEQWRLGYLSAVLRAPN